MDKLRRDIEAFVPLCEQEVRDKEAMLLALDRLDTPLTRENPFAHFTASSQVGRTSKPCRASS